MSVSLQGHDLAKKVPIEKGTTTTTYLGSILCHRGFRVIQLLKMSKLKNRVGIYYLHYMKYNQNKTFIDCNKGLCCRGRRYGNIRLG